MLSCCTNQLNKSKSLYRIGKGMVLNNLTKGTDRPLQGAVSALFPCQTYEILLLPILTVIDTYIVG